MARRISVSSPSRNDHAIGLIVGRFSEGSVDYVFFAVLNNARTAQFEEVKIVDHMPRKQKEWRALVVVEAKVRLGSLL